MRPRPATAADAPAIAALHTDSWQRTYRGDFADDYLDREAPAERLAFWRKRLAAPDPALVVLLAEDDDTGALLGFGAGVLREHPTWGHLVHNLHVVAAAQGQGLGKRLLHALFEAFRQNAPDVAEAYLYVHVSNTRAIAVYERLGGRRGEVHREPAPGGGEVAAYTMHWTLA